MNLNSSSHPRRALALAILAAAACAAAPSSSLASGAETFCVHQSGFVCPAGSIDESADLQAALNDAQNNPVSPDAPNLVDIGPGTYTSPGVFGFTYFSANPVKISGSGAGQTTLANLPVSQGSSSVFVGGTGLAPLGYPAVTLSDVSLTDVNSNADVLTLINGAADHVAVDSTAANVAGLNLEFSTVSSSSVSVSGSGSAGVYTASGGANELSDVKVSAASFGVRTTAQTTLLRTDISAGIALQDMHGAVHIEDSLLRGTSYGLVATDPGGQASISGGDNTIVHTDSGVAAPSYGVYAQATAGNGADIGLVNSIIHGFTYPFGTDSESGSATITESSNNYDGSYLGGGVTTSDPIAGDPGFVDPAHGDYHLAPSSPLIDAVAVTSLSLSSTDLDGNPRVVTVNHAATPLDIGAYEYQPPPAGGGTPGGGNGGNPGGGSTPGSGSPGTSTPGGGAPSNGSGPTPPSHHALTVKVTPVGHVTLIGKRISLVLACTGTAACSPITVTAAAMRRHQRVTVGTLTSRLPAGHRATLMLRLNRTGRALLASAGRLAVTLTVTVRNGSRTQKVETAHLSLT